MKKGVLKLLLMGISYVFIGFLFQLLFINLLWATETKAQEIKDIKDVFVSVEIQDKTLGETFKMLEGLTPFKFVYDKKDSFLMDKFNLEKKTVSIEDILVRMARDSKLSFKQINNNIAVNKRRESQEAVVEIIAQSIEVRGAVTDQTGEPIPGVTVSVPGTTIGTATDLDGRYTLSVPEGSTLVFSFIGFETQTVAVGGRSVINVVLSEDMASLEEVVVVGYGEQKKENLTGAVEVVDGERLQNRPSVNVSQSLQGTVSGMSFSYGNAGAEPGAKLNLQIRGQGQPYVLVDGTVGDINALDPNDIASISVLKDAAASAIYGARAPYGVVLITTKSGKHNEKIKINFSSNVSFTDPIRKPNWVDSHTFVRAMNEFHDNQGEARLFSESTIDRIMAYIDNPNLPETVPDPVNPQGWATYLVSNGNNDWYDIHFGSGMRHQENISASGGGKDIAFFISAGHSFEKGILNFGTDNFKRYNINSKLDINLTPWWKLALNTRAVHTNRIQPNYDSEGDYNQMIRQIYRTQPQQYLKSPNGYYSQLSRIPMVESGTDRTNETELLQRFATEMSPAKNWTINADYSINMPYTSFVSENFTMYQDYVDGTLFPISTTVPSYINKYKAHTLYKSLNIYSSYNFVFDNSHFFEIMGGYQQESSMYDYLYGQKKEMITASVPSLATSTGEMQASDEMNHWANQGYFARMNYDYLGKYLVEVNTRYDGTSKFAEGSRWGVFPSFSLGWNVSHENFWEPISPIINALKIRGSWGALGNQNVAAYQDIPLIGVRTNLGWILNAARPAYTTAPNLINPYLTWESSKTTNIGIDLGLLQNRLQLNADFYQRLTFNRLGPAQALPAVLGSVVPNENNSELRTNGWDLSISWKGQVNKDFSYQVAGMVFDYTNVVTKYNNPTGILTTDYNGKRVGEIWGYETVGLIQSQEEADQINTSGSQNFINAQVWRTGDVHYKDLNGDGVINNGKNTVSDHGDLRVIGNTTPRYQFGLTLSANYKAFDFSAFFNGTAKRDLWLTGNMFWGFQNWNFTILYPGHLDYYRDVEGTEYSGLGINKNAYFPRPYSQGAQYNKNQQVQTRYLQDASYLRLKNLQIGYTIPDHIIKRLSLERTRLYFSGENLLTRTRLPIGFDPETANLGQFGNGNTMFSLAVMSLGLNVSF